MSNTTGLPIKTGYLIKDNTYVKTVDCDGTILDTEIGDAKKAGVFHPQLKVKAFNNASNYSARYNTKGKTGSNKIEHKKLKHDTGVEVVELFDSSNGFEIGVTLNSKPDTNVFEYTLQSKNVEFIYQPDINSLKGDERSKYPDEVYQPENVKHSYAVYAKARPLGVSRESFKCGKIGHIYRPYAEDDNGSFVWCDLNIDQNNGLMTVTVPQEFLDTAKYPVFIDPDFGYTTAGASEATVGAGTKNVVHNNAAMHYTASSDEQIDNFSIYCRITTGSGILEVGAYDMGVTNDPDGATLNSSDDVSFTNTSMAWNTSADVDSNITSGNNYAIGLGDSRPTTGTIKVAFDGTGVSANNTMDETSTTGALDATFNNNDGTVSYAFSMYATVGAAAGPPVFSGTIPDQAFARTDSVSIATASYFTNPESFSMTGAPAFLSIDSDTGVITNNSANVNGVYSGITVTCTNGLGSDDSNAFQITINAQAPVLDTAITNKNGNVGSAITTVEAGGNFSFATSYSATGLPDGLSIDSGTGDITGTPTTEATSTGVYVTATNADGSTNSNTFTWTIGAALPIPIISAVNSGNNLQRGQSITITGTNFESPQGTGTVTFNAVSLTATSWSDTSITVTVPDEGFIFGASNTLEITNDSGYSVTSSDQFVPESGYTYSTLSVNYAQLPTSSFLDGVVGLESISVGDQVMYQTAASPEGTVAVDDEGVAVISGATAAGDYTFNYLVNDVSDLTVSSNGTAVVTFQGSGADITAPSWVSAPSVGSITTTGATIAATINETGAIYGVVVPQADATPTIAQIKLGQNSAGSAALAAVSVTSNTALSEAVTGLTEDTLYKACLFAEDDETTPNQQVSATIVNFRTVADIDTAPPVFATGPSVTQVTQTTAILNATIDESGTIHWVVIPQGYPNPSPSQIVSGEISNPLNEPEPAIDAGSGSSIVDVQASQLPTGTALKACFAARDVNNNLQVSGTVVNFSTSQSGTARSISDQLVNPETGAAVASTTVDYIVQPVWSSAPTDSGQLTTDGSGNFTINSLNAAAGPAYITFKTPDDTQGTPPRLVTVTEA